ncbi:unnamed protein product [Paramecium pentaurelia]|uniref:Uncharacterized protein n=1 Tax=Paramecium pentaurelia TaxID=43138 RepID=A0A8S1XQG9_9CILI|nr:unnamed protein product [Paramecium pentaurelia]
MFVKSSIQHVEAIQNQSTIIEQKIQNEIEEASKFFGITKIDSDIRTSLKQQEYLCRLLENIEILILFNYNFPKSNPKYFVLQKFEKNPLIDEETWQIKIENENTILNTLNSLLIQFTQNPPQPDMWIQQQIQQSTQQLPIPLNDFNNQEISMLNKILEVQIKRDLLQIMKQKAIKNQDLLEKIQQNYIEIEKLKQDLKIVYNKFQEVQQNATILNAQCSTIINKFSNYELLRILQDKQGQLDKTQEQYYELKLKDTIDEKESIYNQFLNNRMEFHKCNSTLTILKQNIYQQSFIN